jgi:hypothetical protein
MYPPRVWIELSKAPTEMVTSETIHVCDNRGIGELFLNLFDLHGIYPTRLLCEPARSLLVNSHSFASRAKTL